MSKHEWRKHEKPLYLPPKEPVRIDVPAMKFYTISGEGNPNSEQFPEYIQVLYALSYGVKMTGKKPKGPKDYFDYTVYPLEGVWDINDEAKTHFDGTINKDDFVFKLMIRQPDFVDEKYAQSVLDQVKEKKGLPLIDQVKFEVIEEGDCIQMLHLGSYDDEPASFDKMERFAQQNNLIRKSKVHREIYLSDARKVAPEKLKTVLRFKLKT